MSFTNSKLATYTKVSPNKSSRTVDGKTYTIDTITIHCMAAPWTGKRCADYFNNSSVEASSNYCVGVDGDIALAVPEQYRSWASSNRINDARAITIEVGCELNHPYAVTDKAYNALIKLLVDVCKRNGIKKLVWSTSKDNRINHKNGCNMTVHRDFANKACPGDYLYNKHGAIAAEVNKQLEEPKQPTQSKEENDMTEAQVIEIIKKQMDVVAEYKDVPKALQPEVRKLLDMNAINGGTTQDVNPNDINMPYQDIRTLICAARYTDTKNEDIQKSIAAINSRLDKMGDEIVAKVVKDVTAQVADKVAAQVANQIAADVAAGAIKEIINKLSAK